MSSATVMALIYINMQMQIVDLAYKGKDKERKMRELNDSNGALDHQILSLKSANYLGQEILDKDGGLQFMGHDRVMLYSAPALRAPSRPLEKPRVKAEAPLWNLLSFLSPQEAKAWDH